MSPPPETREPSSRAREGLKVWGTVILVALVGFAAAYPFVEPAPPDSIVLATGDADGAYHAYGRQYAAALQEYGIEVELRTSAGSVENAAHLRAAAADVAFVQGGVLSAEDSAELEGIASLYLEPLWIFHRAELEVARLTALAGARIQVGPEGSGTRAVATSLLDANGIDGKNATLLGATTDEAVEQLLAGDVDAAFLVISARSEAISRLMEAEGQTVRLMDVDRHLAYVRRFPYLAHAVLAEGVLDLGRDVPDREVDLVAPTAMLVARSELHPAVLPLFIQAAERIHGGGDVFAEPGAFPSPEHLDVALGTSAAWYFEHGQSFLYRVFPFQLAAAIDRLKILLLPLLTLLIPLFKLAPPLYQWRIRSKIYRWYRELDRVERRSVGAEDGAGREARTRELDRIDREIRETVDVPASYMEELYNLRMHLDRLRRG